MCYDGLAEADKTIVGKVSNAGRIVIFWREPSALMCGHHQNDLADSSMIQLLKVS